MSGTDWTAQRVLDALTPGMRMRTLFDTAKAAAGIPDDEREKLFHERSYEWFVKYGDDQDVEAGLAVAELLHADPDPLVHKPVGIYLAYAGDRLPDRWTEFLDQHAEAMPRAAYRIATRKRRHA